MPDTPHFLKQKLAEGRAQLAYIPQAVALVWTAARPWTIAWAVLLVLLGLLPVTTVYLTRTVVDSLVAALDAGGDWASLQPTLLRIALMAGILLLLEILNSLSHWIRTTQAELVQDYVSGLIHHQAVSLDLAYYETPEYYDRLHRARVDAFNRPIALLENCGALVQNTITLIAMAGVLLPFGMWVPAVLLISTLPALIVAFRYTLRQHQWRLHNTATERRARYYDWILTQQESAAELRLFGLGDHFQTAFQSLRYRLRSQILALTRSQAFAELAASTVALIATGAALAWMVWRAVQGHATLGDVALFYQAFSQGQRLMRTLLESAGELYKNILFLENLFEFLALTPQLTEPAQPVAVPSPILDGINLENITFRYPGSQRTALQHFNLALPAGKIVALVGPNGSGKSTLIKLLCRLYDPEAGQITIDGTDIRNVSLEALRRQITVLFQEPVHYHATAAENIAISDDTHTHTRATLESAAHAAGADGPIRRLPEGYDTVLGKWFGGAELSVGEWQRLALARAFLRQAPLIILDEPTSAMDAWAEADWLERFRHLAVGRIVLIITHRFTTARQADLIYVMEAGQIVESGSHEELLARGGRYAQSWQAQMHNHHIPPLPT